MTDHKAAMEHAQQFADSTQSGEHSNLCRAYLELAQRIKESQEQDPAGSFVQCNGEHWATWRQTKYGHPGSEKLYLHPPIQPTQQEAIDKAVAEERERCASIANNMFHAAAQGDEIAEAIRKGE